MRQSVQYLTAWLQTITLAAGSFSQTVKLRCAGKRVTIRKFFAGS
jgi:hypothetical protein